MLRARYYENIITFIVVSELIYNSLPDLIINGYFILNVKFPNYGYIIYT